MLICSYRFFCSFLKKKNTASDSYLCPSLCLLLSISILYLYLSPSLIFFFFASGHILCLSLLTRCFDTFLPISFQLTLLLLYLFLSFILPYSFFICTNFSSLRSVSKIHRMNNKNNDRLLYCIVARCDVSSF